MNLPTWLKLTTCVLVLIGVVACESTQTKTPEPDNAVFYPEPPAAPRIQFLASFTNGYELITEGKKQTSLADWVVGNTGEEAEQDATFGTPYGVAARDGKVYLCDVGRNRVHVIDMVNNTYSNLGNPQLVRNPVNLTIGEDGMRYLCDTSRRKVVVFDASDNYVREFGDPAEWMPIDLAEYNNELYIVDVRGGEIEVWSKDGQKLRAIARKGQGPEELQNPTNLEIGPDGRIFVTDIIKQIVNIYDPQGGYQGAISGPGAAIGRFARPKGISVDPEGQIYVADSQWEVIQVFNADGELMMFFGRPGDKPYSTGMPAGLVVDASSVPQFKRYLSRNFDAEYLLFVVNQFGKNKLAVYAYGRDRTVDPKEYEVDMAEVERRRQELRKIRQEQSQDGANPATGPGPVPGS